jgi:PPOX class probable F420-dependent enzyme
MAENIPEKYADLLEKPAFGNLGTIMKDGSPQVTPIWVDYDGKYVRFNSALGRVKDKNVRRDPRVSVSLQDPANRCRRPHQQTLAKISRQARLPVPPTRRSARPL